MKKVRIAALIAAPAMAVALAGGVAAGGAAAATPTHITLHCINGRSYVIPYNTTDVQLANTYNAYHLCTFVVS